MLCVHGGAQCCIISSQWKFLPASLGAGLDPFFLCWKCWGSINAVWMQACFPGCAAAPKWRAVVSVRGVWQWSLEHSGQAAVVLAVPCRSKQMGSQRGMAGSGSLDRLAQLNLPNARRKWAAPEEGQSFPYAWPLKWEQQRAKQGSPTCSLLPALSQSQWLSQWVI